MTACILVFVGFLSGSVPFGLLLVKNAGKGDIRSVGSGNIGATNVVRAGGKWLGLLTLVLDVSKGFFPVFFASLYFKLDATALSFVALACVAGHIFTPWLRFKGGKGVATALGTALAFNHMVLLPSLGVFFLSVLLTRYVSLGSVLAAIALPVFLLLGSGKYLSSEEKMVEPLLFFSWFVIAILVIFKHHANISRLLKGTENRLWDKKNVVGKNE